MKDDDENTTQAQYLVSSSYSESIESVMIEEFRTRLRLFRLTRLKAIDDNHQKTFFLKRMLFEYH